MIIYLIHESEHVHNAERTSTSCLNFDTHNYMYYTFNYNSAIGININ